MHTKAFPSSFSQVMFQSKPLSGIFVIIGIVIGAVAEGRMEVAMGALLATATAILTAHCMRRPEEDIDLGLWGFNGVLVGCAVMSFFAPTPLGWVATVLTAALSVAVQQTMARCLGLVGQSTFTMPFVVCTWILCAASYNFGSLEGSLLPHPMLPSSPINHLPATVGSPWDVGVWVLRGVGQIFLLGNALAGLLFVVALAVSNWRAALWAVVGSAVGIGTAWLFGASEAALSQGLYSFSPALTAIALGCTFRHSIPLAIVGAVVTTFIQAAVDVVLSPLGLPALTSPFCLATWLLLLASDSKQ